MRKPLDQTAIDAITRAGFDVYMQDRSQSWAMFTDGANIGYVQNGAFGGFDLSTVHRPNRTTGTGFKLHEGIEAGAMSRKTLETCFTYAPEWARGLVRGSDLHNETRKWRDFEQFRGADSFNAKYALAAKRAPAIDGGSNERA